MNDRLTTLLHDEAARFDVRPPEAAELRRTAEHKRAVRRGTAAAIAAATAVGIVALFTLSNPLIGANQPNVPGTPTKTNSNVAPTRAPSESQTSSTFTLARIPFLTDYDLRGWQGVARNANARLPWLSPCLPDPRSWGAAQSQAATYSSPSDPTAGLNEFVLRFADTASAHRAFVHAQTSLRTCPGNRSGGPEAVRPVNYDMGRYPIKILDESLGGPAGLVHATNGRAEPSTARIARAGNVVIVIEDISMGDRRGWIILTVAMYRASPQYRTMLAAQHLGVRCFQGSVCY